MTRPEGKWPAHDNEERMRVNLLLAMGILGFALTPLAAGQLGYNNSTSTPEESTTFSGLSTTALVVLIVLSVVVIALIIALASAGRSGP